MPTVAVRKPAIFAALAFFLVLIGSGGFLLTPAAAMGPQSTACSNLYYVSSISSFSINYPSFPYANSIDVVQHPNATISLPEGSFYDASANVQTAAKSANGNTNAGEVWDSSDAASFNNSGCSAITAPGGNVVSFYEIHNCCSPLVGVQHVTFEFLESGTSNQAGAKYVTVAYNVDWIPWNVTTTSTLTTSTTVTSTNTVTSVSTTTAPAVTNTITTTTTAPAVTSTVTSVSTTTTSSAVTNTITSIPPATTATQTETNTVTVIASATASGGSGSGASSSTLSGSSTTTTTNPAPTATVTATYTVTSTAMATSTNSNSISRDFEYGIGAILAFIIISVVGVTLLRRRNEAAYKNAASSA